MAAARELADGSPSGSVVIGCLACGQVQRAPVPSPGVAVRCATCRSPLERSRWRSIATAGALSVATLLVLFPAIGLPLMRTALLTTVREASVTTCLREMLHEGWPELALAILSFVIVFPLVRFALLSAVLGSLVARRRLPAAGALFRHAMVLQPWAMPEVFLLSFVIAALRLRATVDVQIGTGGYCLIAAGILSLLTRASLSEAAVWRAILPDPPARGRSRGLWPCTTCAFVADLDEIGETCPRCAARFRRRKPFALARGLALTIAGALLYLPANLYPIATLPIGAHSSRYTVLEGVIDLAQAKLLGLALIVLTASFIIPILKLAAMAWCVSSVLHRSDRHVRKKMNAYAFAEEIGRWSMVDPFVIAVLAPVASFNSFIYGRAELGAPFFTMVVVMTMVAVRRFDPRHLWDAAREPA